MDNSFNYKRSLYIPSSFAKKSLIYLQEVGESTTYNLHTNSRNGLDSYLFFIVEEGQGSFTYENKTYELSKNDCVFIDCRKAFSHTSDNWSIKWIHFDGLNMRDIYDEYKGEIVFKTKYESSYFNLIDEIYDISISDNNLRDFKLYELLVSIINQIVSETSITFKNKHDLDSIKNYIDLNYTKNICLDELSNLFYINKFYLTRTFKKIYGRTINTYINELRIKEAKELLRYTSLSIENIGFKCGYNDLSYFSKVFKKYELLSPNEYRKNW